MLNRVCLSLVAVVVLSGFTSGDQLAVTIKEAPEIRKKLGLDEYSQVKVNQIKVAVLDYGFAGVLPGGMAVQAGVETGLRYLPATTEIIGTYPDIQGEPLDENNPHGRQVAQIVWSMTHYQPDGPRFRLYNANGQEHFRAAARAASEWGADIIVNAVTWPGLGDFGGDSPIDVAMQSAVDAGALWFNAAGNNGAGMVANGHFKFMPASDNGRLVLNKNGQWHFRFRNNVDDNHLVITLSWNSGTFGPEFLGTDKDLTLNLGILGQDSYEKPPLRLAQSNLKQVKLENYTGAPNETIHALETIKTSLKAYKDRDYVIWISNKNPDIVNQFSHKDKFRLLIETDKKPVIDAATNQEMAPIVFYDATHDGSLNTAADGPGITVGNLSPTSSKGPTRDGRSKPEFLLAEQEVTFSNDEGLEGTSYSVAYLAGAALLLKAAEPRMTVKHFLKFRAPYPWQELGWETSVNKISELLYGPKQRETTAGYIFYKYPFTQSGVKGRKDGLVTFGTTKDFFVDFPGLPAEARANYKNYDFYLYSARKETTIQVKNLPRVVNEPVITKPGGMTVMAVPSTATVSMLDMFGQLVAVNVPTLNYVSVPTAPEYENRFRLVDDTGYRTEVGAPTIEQKYWFKLKSLHQVPWSEGLGDNNPERFVKMEFLEAPSALENGLVTDGGQNDPRFWKSPTLAELKKVVEGN